MKGWIILHRQMVNWEWYDDLPTFRLFVHLILTANHKPRKWKGKCIGRGQKLTSRAKLAEETGLSEQQIRTCLNRLKSTGEITIDSTNKETVISICNYDTYQAKGEATNQRINRGSTAPTASDQPSNEQECCRNVSKEKISPPPELNRDEFLDKWNEYEAYRKETKLRKLKPVSIEKKWKEMATWGLRASIEAIDQTIANGWQSIFEPTSSKGKNGSHKTFDRSAGTANEGAGNYSKKVVRV